MLISGCTGNLPLSIFKLLLILLLLLAPVTYNQVQPLRINYLASQFKPYTLLPLHGKSE